MQNQENPITERTQDQPAEEKLIWEGSPKWQADFKDLFLASLVNLFGFILMILLLIYTSWTMYITVVFPLIIMATGGFWFLWIRLKRKNERYKITTLNLEYEHGVLDKSIHNLEMWRIRDIVFMQNFFDRILGISKIKLVTSDPDTPVIIIEGLPPGRRIYEDIKQAFLLARQRKNIVGFVE